MNKLIYAITGLKLALLSREQANSVLIVDTFRNFYGERVTFFGEGRAFGFGFETFYGVSVGIVLDLVGVTLIEFRLFGTYANIGGGIFGLVFAGFFLRRIDFGDYERFDDATNGVIFYCGTALAGERHLDRFTELFYGVIRLLMLSSIRM